MIGRNKRNKSILPADIMSTDGGVIQDMQDRGLAAYYQVWLQQSQYNKYIRYSGWYLLMIVVWYMSLYRTGTLPGYMQDYSSNSKSIGKAHGMGPASIQGTHHGPYTQNG